MMGPFSKEQTLELMQPMLSSIHAQIAACGDILEEILKRQNILSSRISDLALAVAISEAKPQPKPKRRTKKKKRSKRGS